MSDQHPPIPARDCPWCAAPLKVLERPDDGLRRIVCVNRKCVRIRTHWLPVADVISIMNGEFADRGAIGEMVHTDRCARVTTQGAGDCDCDGGPTITSLESVADFKRIAEA